MKNETESKWENVEYNENIINYDHLQKFINSLNTKERKVVGYEVTKRTGGLDKIIVTFANVSI